MPYDQSKADRVIQFAEMYGVHSKGPLAGQPLKLADWQKRDIIEPLFGTVDENGLRQYKQGLIFMPRKQGKSFLSSALSLYMLLGDGESGAEVYTVARDRSQAAIVFNQTAQFIKASPELSKLCRIIDSTKRVLYKDRVLRVLSSDASSAMGLNPSCCIMDEIAFWPDRDLYDALVSATKARKQPLILSITTASNDVYGIGRELYDYAKDVRNGIKIDPRFFSYIREAPIDADVTDRKVWTLANPGMGTADEVASGKALFPITAIEDEFVQALNEPSAMLRFRMLTLNQWVTEQETPYIPLSKWDACSEPLPDLANATCYAGLDLSQKMDLTAFSMVFPQGEGFAVKTHFWMPAEGIREREIKDRAPYSQWAQKGFITLIPGPVVKNSFVITKILEFAKEHNIREVAFDRYGAVDVVSELEANGLTVVEFGQGFLSMSHPTKSLRELVYSMQIIHGGNPVLRWNISCAHTVSDAAANIKVVKQDKRKNYNRIDGVITTIMGLDRAMRHNHQPQNKPDLSDFINSPLVFTF
jgi:phage terminase large subunit-like protein